MTFEKIKKQLSSKVVGIAGCGGLGSNCAVALARTGVGTLIVADFDSIIESNLNRQYFFHNQIGRKKAYCLQENIFRIDPGIKVIAHDLKLEPDTIAEVFVNCDVIVEAFDLAVMKQMIIETVLARFPEKWIVSGVGLAGWGDNNSLKEVRHEKLIVCGDGVKEVSDELPPLAPRVGVVANMQANAVLEILLGVNPS